MAVGHAIEIAAINVYTTTEIPVASVTGDVNELCIHFGQSFFMLQLMTWLDPRNTLG